MTKTKEEQVKEAIGILNALVKVKIAPSKIDKGGVGVFAMRDIPKDTRLYANMFPQLYNIPYEEMSRLLPDVRDYLLERWATIVNGSAFMWPDTNIQAFMNHSEKNNYDGVLDLTLRDIKKGEEITENYRQIKGWERVFPWLIHNKK